MHSVLRAQCAQTTERAHHEVLEDLVVRLIAGPVLLEAGDDGRISLAAGATGERRVELGVRGGCIGAGALLLLDGDRGAAHGGERLARGLSADGGGEASGERHGGGLGGVDDDSAAGRGVLRS